MPESSVALEAREVCAEVAVARLAESVCWADTALRDVLGPATTSGLREPGTTLGPRVRELFRAGGTVDVEAVALATPAAPGVSVTLVAAEAWAAVLVTVAAESVCGSAAALKDVLTSSAGSRFRDAGVKFVLPLKELFRVADAVDDSPVASVASVKAADGEGEEARPSTAKLGIETPTVLFATPDGTSDDACVPVLASVGSLDCGAACKG